MRGVSWLHCRSNSPFGLSCAVGCASPGCSSFIKLIVAPSIGLLSGDIQVPDIEFADRNWMTKPNSSYRLLCLSTNGIHPIPSFSCPTTMLPYQELDQRFGNAGDLTFLNWNLPSAPVVVLANTSFTRTRCRSGRLM